MTLADYLAETGQRPAQFAARVGTPRQNVSRWLAGRNIPRQREMDRIFSETGGKVGPADFYPQPSTTAAE